MSPILDIFSLSLLDILSLSLLDIFSLSPRSPLPFSPQYLLPLSSIFSPQYPLPFSPRYPLPFLFIAYTAELQSKGTSMVNCSSGVCSFKITKRRSNPLLLCTRSVTYMYCTLLKMHPLRQKWRRGVCSTIQFSLVHTFSVLCNVMCVVDNHDDCGKELQLHWTCTGEISGTCVDTKSRGIEATCIVSGDRKWLG